MKKRAASWTLAALWGSEFPITNRVQAEVEDRVWRNKEAQLSSTPAGSSLGTFICVELGSRRRFGGNGGV